MIREGRILWDSGDADARRLAVDLFFQSHIEQGAAKVDVHIGDLYLQGLSVPRDEKEAAAWYQVSFVASDEQILASAFNRLKKLFTIPRLSGEMRQRAQDYDGPALWKPRP